MTDGSQRPESATPEHLPVWHRFQDNPTGDTAEHISHWITDPGPFGYLSDTHPIAPDGRAIGTERAQCFGCGHPVVSRHGTFYRRYQSAIYLRCDDDPDYEAPNRST